MSALDKARAKIRERSRQQQEAEEAKPVPWLNPVALEAPSEPPPPFPLEVLHPSMRDLCIDISEAVNCPVDYPACSMLGLAAGAIGAQVEVQIKDGYQERACLFVGMVGGSSARKSPPMKILSRPMVAEQSRRVAELAKLPDDMLPTVYEHGQGEIMVGDITTEELGMMMLRQPRGLTLTMEELIAWVRGQNMYKPGGKGNDRQFYLQVWDGTPISVNRINSARKIWVPRPTLSVLGGMQPDIVREFLTIRDGFAERILFCFPDPKPARKENWLTVNPKLFGTWCLGYERIHGLKMKEGDKDGDRPRPHVMRLDADARKAWEDHTEMLANIRNGGELPDYLQSYAGKQDGYGARLALVRAILNSAVGGPSLREITGDDMKAGAKLAMYFLEHAKRAFAVGGISARPAEVDATTTGAKRIVAWAVKHQHSVFVRSDAYRGLRGTFANPDAMGPAIRLLVQHNILRYAPEEYAGKGRRPTPSFEVHPAVLDGRFNPLVGEREEIVAEVKVSEPENAPLIINTDADDAMDTPLDTGDDGPEDTGEPIYEYE